MMKHLLSISILFLGLNGFSQSFSGMYDFSAVVSGTAGTGMTDPTVPPFATGVIFGSFTSVGTSTTPAANSVFGFSGWDATIANANDAYLTYTGSINPAKYYQVTLTPNGASLTLNSITFNMSRSSQGPRNWAVRSDKDSYTANLSAGISPANANINVQTGNVFFLGFG